MKQINASWQTVESDGSPMRLYVARPDSNEPAPAIMVFQEAFGINQHMREVTQRIASLGFLAVAPELFHRTAPGFEGDYNDLSKSRPHMEDLTGGKLESDIQATYGWLKSDAQAQPDKLAAVGFCMGGKAAFIANAILPLKAAVSYYGTAIPDLLPIYADRQKAPLLLNWGGQDSRADGSKREEVTETLRQASKRYIQVVYSEAGHGFFCPERSSYNADAASESWAMMAMFLKNKLG